MYDSQKKSIIKHIMYITIVAAILFFWSRSNINLGREIAERTRINIKLEATNTELEKQLNSSGRELAEIRAVYNGLREENNKLGDRLIESLGTANTIEEIIGRIEAILRELISYGEE